MGQQIKKISISELHLWIENPRDPIDRSMSDEEIILRAINQKVNKWDLEKLIKEMGDSYDLSELPTVVKENDKYVVYDGNRRVAIIKYSQNPQWSQKIENKLFPTNLSQNFKNMATIECNVCNKETALHNVERKHINSGTWKELERSYFLYHHRKKPKNNFLIIEEDTGGIISNNKNMNQRFVAEEILTNENLKKIGFNIEGEKLLTNYDEDKTKSILDKIVELINHKEISTRKNRGELLEPLKKDYSDLSLEKFDGAQKKNNVKEMFLNYENSNISDQIRKTPRIKEIKLLFGGSLKLKLGVTNNIYRDIQNLYEFYEKEKNKLSENFPSLIRMSLRLLVESALDLKNGKKINSYIKKYFENAKKTLDQNQKTTLSTQKINKKDDFVKLLHVGAHDYTASKNLEQTLAMSLIIGRMLKLSHSNK